MANQVHLESQPDMRDTPASSSASSSNLVADCKILAVDSPKYGLVIYKRLTTVGIKAELIYLHESSFINIQFVLSEFARKGSICAVVVNSKNEKDRTVDVHFLRGLRQVQNKLTITKSIKVIQSQFKMVTQELDNKMKTTVPLRKTPPARALKLSSAPQDGKLEYSQKDQEHVDLLKSGKDLTTKQYDYLIGLMHKLRRKELDKLTNGKGKKTEEVKDPATKVKGNFYYPDIESIQRDTELLDLLREPAVQAALDDCCKTDLFKRMVESLSIDDSSDDD